MCHAGTVSATEHDTLGEVSRATSIAAFTTVLLKLNVRHTTRVAPRLTGINDPS